MPLSLSNWVADIFADDTTLSAHHQNSDDVISSLTSDLCNVDIWCSDNHMAINVTKSKLIAIWLSLHHMAINVTKSKLILVSSMHKHSQL